MRRVQGFAPMKLAARTQELRPLNSTGWLKKIVLVRSDRRLFAKVVGHEGDQVDVEFFLSAADREVTRCSLRDITHAYVPAQTRVFNEISPNHWRVGRVVDRYKTDTGAYSYTVQFPNE